MKKSYKLEQKLDKFPFKCSCVENIIMLIMTLISGTCMILQVQAISDFIDNALLFLEKQKLDVDFYNSALQKQRFFSMFHTSDNTPLHLVFRADVRLPHIPVKGTGFQ